MSDEKRQLAKFELVGRGQDAGGVVFPGQAGKGGGEVAYRILSWAGGHVAKGAPVAIRVQGGDASQLQVAGLKTFLHGKYRTFEWVVAKWCTPYTLNNEFAPAKIKENCQKVEKIPRQADGEFLLTVVTAGGGLAQGDRQDQAEAAEDLLAAGDQVALAGGKLVEGEATKGDHLVGWASLGPVVAEKDWQGNQEGAQQDPAGDFKAEAEGEVAEHG